MAEDDQARARDGGLDVEITVEEPPARVKRASEPSDPVQTDAAEPEEPSPEDIEEGLGGDGDGQGGNRLTALVGKLRDKARRKEDEPGSRDDDASPDPAPEPERAHDPEPERAGDRPAVRASGFTILSYRSGPGQNGDPPVPGRQKTTPPEEEAAEVEEPRPVDETPETPETEQSDQGMTDAPPIPADEIETSDPEDQVAIEIEEPAAEIAEPAAEIAEPDQAPDEEALEAHDEPEAPEQAVEADAAQESPGFLAGLRDRFSSDDEPEEEALEAQDEPEPEEQADSPGVFTRLRSKLSRSKADAIEVPTAMPAPPPTPPLATAEVQVADEPEEAEESQEAEDSPGLFARLTGKASRDEEPEPEPEPELATAEEPSKTAGFFSRLKEKVSRSGSGIEDPLDAELDLPPTPPTGDRQPEIIAAMGRSPEPRASDLESLEATIEAVEAEETPEPEPATAEVQVADEPEEAEESEEVEDSPGLFARLKGTISSDEEPEPEPEQAPEPEPATAEEPAKKGGFLSRLKDKVSGADQAPEDQTADEPEGAPAPTTPLEDPHEDAVEGGPEVPPTGDRHPELIAAMSTETQTVEEPEEPDTVDAETEEQPAEKGGLLSRLKDKVAGSDQPAEQEPDVAAPPEPEVAEAEASEPVEADEPSEPDQAPEPKAGLFSRLKDKVAGSDEADGDETEVDQAPEPEEAPEPPAVEVEEPEPAVAEEPAAEEVETSKPSEPEPAVAEDPEPEAVEAEEPPEALEPATAETDRAGSPAPETVIDQMADEVPEAEGDGGLPYEEIVRRVETLLERRREDPEKSAAREKVRILAGGSKR